MSPAFDPGLYPRFYKTPPFARVAWLSLAGLITAAGLAGAVYFSTGHATQSPQAAATLAFLCSLFAFLGLYTIASVLRSKIALKPDSLELFTVSGSGYYSAPKSWAGVPCRHPIFLLSKSTLATALKRNSQPGS